MEVDGDEFAVVGFDEFADVCIGNLDAGGSVFPTVVAGGVIAVRLEPCGDFFRRGNRAFNKRLRNDKGRSLVRSENPVEPYVVAEEAIGKADVLQICDAALGTDVGREGEFHNPPEFFQVKNRVFRLPA